MSELTELGERTRSSVPILIAEDSPLLNKLIVDSLKAAGYVNLIHTENGQKAYDVITQCKEDGTLDQHVRCIITVVHALKIYITAIPAIIITVGELFLILATAMMTNIGTSEKMKALRTIAY